VFGSALSAAAAALLVIAVGRSDLGQVIVSDVVSAHLRSLQVNHLTDVQTSDQQGVNPCFSDRLGVAPPVPDLTSQGFNLSAGGSTLSSGRRSRDSISAERPRH
jgi:anti-sigma factor RsiW